MCYERVLLMVWLSNFFFLVFDCNEWMSLLSWLLLLFFFVFSYVFINDDNVLIYIWFSIHRWSYLLFQLFNYYLTDLRTTKTLWDYVGNTVIIFQNAAVLEVCALNLKNILKKRRFSFWIFIIFYFRLFMRPLESSQVTSCSPHSKSCRVLCWFAVFSWLPRLPFFHPDYR